MVGVPIISSFGDRARVRAISAGVGVQGVTVVLMLVATMSPGSTILTVAFILPTAWLAEYVGSRTGFPFGRYTYTPILRPQIKHVPVAVPFAWLMMLPPSWAVAGFLVGYENRPVFVIVSALAFTAWDFFLDPQMVKWHYWKWDQPGRYYGIPAQNFLGWFCWAAIITALVTALVPILMPAAGGFPASELPWQLAGIYVLTWLFQFGGQLLFWKLYGSAITGFLAMGIFALPVLLSVFFP